MRFLRRWDLATEATYGGPGSVGASSPALIVSGFAVSKKLANTVLLLIAVLLIVAALFLIFGTENILIRRP